MTWNIAPESISLVMLGIILIYSRKGSHLPTLKNRMFQGCLFVTFCAMLTNILSTVMIYFYQIIPLWMTWLITTLYFILTPLMGKGISLLLYPGAWICCSCCAQPIYPEYLRSYSSPRVYAGKHDWHNLPHLLFLLPGMYCGYPEKLSET